MEKKFTIEDLKKYKGFEDVSDEEAKELIETMYKFAILAYKLYRRDKILYPETGGINPNK